MNIGQYISARYGEGSGEAVKGLFKVLAIALPEGNEYIVTNDGGAIVFLNEEACTIRLTLDDSYPSLEHPRILKPLGSLMAGRMRFDINPGICTYGTEEEAIELKKILLPGGINLSDSGKKNIGYLPPQNQKSGSRHTLLIDLAAARRFFYCDTPVENCPQEDLYGFLRKDFKSILDVNGDPDPLKAEAFWQECRVAAKNGHMVASWLNQSQDYKNIFQASQAYSAHAHHIG